MKNRKVLVGVLTAAFAGLVSISAVIAGATVYTHPTDFETATAGLGDPTVIDFDGIDASPVNNTFEGRDPFDGNFFADQGITFSNPNGYPLYISPGGLFWNVSNSLSVGRFPFDPFKPNLWYEDDDLLIALNPPCAAIGFTFVDNGAGADEFVQFIDSDGGVVQQVDFPPNYTSYRAFLGIVSVDRPIATVNIVEAADDGDDVNYDDFTCFPAVLLVTIDIKPGSDPNCFNSDGHGVIPVAILGSADFDASTIDPFTVMLDSASVRVKGKSGNAGSLEDVNGDGFQDLVVQIIDDGGYSSGDTMATLHGTTFGGVPIEGSDSICIRPPE